MKVDNSETAIWALSWDAGFALAGTQIHSEEEKKEED